MYYFVSFLVFFFNHIDEEERAGCLAFIVYWMPYFCKCSVALPHGFKTVLLLLIFFFYFVLVFAILPCLCHAVLWSPVGKEVTSWLSCM